MMICMSRDQKRGIKRPGHNVCPGNILYLASSQPDLGKGQDFGDATSLQSCMPR